MPLRLAAAAAAVGRGFFESPLDLSGRWQSTDGSPGSFIFEHFEDPGAPIAWPNTTYALRCIEACWWKAAFCRLGDEDLRASDAPPSPSSPLSLSCELDAGSSRQGRLVLHGRATSNMFIEWDFDQETVLQEVWRRDSNASRPPHGRLDVQRPVHRVHVVFSSLYGHGSHAWINDQDNEQMHEFLTRVGKLSEEADTRSGGNSSEFFYVTYPWLLQRFLQCPCSESPSPCLARTLGQPNATPLHCPSQREVESIEAAIRSGRLVWSAGPLSFEAEGISPELFKAGLRLSERLDLKFYGQHRTKTMVTSGSVSRGIVPLLRDHGITGLVIGPAGGAELRGGVLPQVPKLHRWLDADSGADVVVAYLPFGDTGRRLPDCAESPNGVVLCTRFGAAGAGPPASLAEVRQALDEVRIAYPSAEVFASTFDRFMEEVAPFKAALPVVRLEALHSVALKLCIDTSGQAYEVAVARVRKINREHHLNGTKDEDKLPHEPLPSETAPNAWASAALFATLSLHALFHLLCHWKVSFHVSMFFQPAKAVREGYFVQVAPMAHRGQPELVELVNSESSLRLGFAFQRQRYEYWGPGEGVSAECAGTGSADVDDEEEGEVRLTLCPINLPLSKYTEAEGLVGSELPEELKERFGDNHLEVALPSFIQCYKEQLLSPLVIFQIFVALLWAADDFMQYTLMQLLFIGVFESTSVFQRLKTMKMLNSMGTKSYGIMAYRQRTWMEVSTADLVPGDLVELTSVKAPPPAVAVAPGALPMNIAPDIVPCDCVIIRGEAIASEASLTGESAPQMKDALAREDGRQLDLQGVDRVHCLFSGTRLLRASEGSKAQRKAGANSGFGLVARPASRVPSKACPPNVASQILSNGTIMLFVFVFVLFMVRIDLCEVLPLSLEWLVSFLSAQPLFQERPKLQRQWLVHSWSANGSCEALRLQGRGPTYPTQQGAQDTRWRLPVLRGLRLRLPHGLRAVARPLRDDCVTKPLEVSALYAGKLG
ncbi:unnamed protein product [Polarella glacialis]|uniref:P-type ATPase A domain-containing protein n=1 Tax=Polarella glacialis TaxID=89957 RepID=A0A813LJ04_POLGL|nr:unnamed protein product [Polarella glacialis]